MSTDTSQSSQEALSISEQPINRVEETPPDLPPVKQNVVDDHASDTNESRNTPPPAEGSSPVQAQTSLQAQPAEENLGRTATVAHFPMANRFPVQVYANETFSQKIGHWGPTIMTIVVTLFVWYHGDKLGKQQVELQNQLVQAELNDMRSKFFNDLTVADENKRTLAEIGLAGHGTKALQVVHLALGVEQGDIRKSAVNVVYRLFQAAMNTSERDEILNHLTKEFNSPNKNLRMGVVQCMVKIEPLMNPSERQRFTNFLLTNVNPMNICTDREGRETVQEAAKFFNAKNTESTKYLLAIARCPKCGDGWLQAMYKLSALLPELPSLQSTDLLTRLKGLREEVLGSLREKVSDEDLNKGAGFGKFLQKGQEKITFEGFKQKVQEMFDEVVPSTDEQ